MKICATENLCDTRITCEEGQNLLNQMKRQSSIFIKGAGSSVASQILPVHDELKTPLISVIIPCYQQADFLSCAIESVRSQSYRCVEIVVVNDGSRDHTSEVVRRYDGVHYIMQSHQGLAAARNTGIRNSRGSYLVFLDADDRLLPNALAAGKRCFREHPECAFVSGDYRRVSANGHILKQHGPSQIDKDHYLTLLRGNYIGMHATVIYRREALERAGGFDTSLAACEDYDLYLRLAKRFPIYHHDEVVAEYCIHEANMSRNTRLMLKNALAVLRSQWQDIKQNQRYRQAYKLGIKAWKEYYSRALIKQVNVHLRTRGEAWQAGQAVMTLLRYAPLRFAKYVANYIGRAGQRMLKVLLPISLRHRLKSQNVNRVSTPSVGRVRLGALRRVQPISGVFGYDRGLPIDRYYIENFLARYMDDIKGGVLEIGDNAYTRRFGGDKVLVSDILHVAEGNLLATLVGDLARADHIPTAAFDCVILTQTLHLIYDVRAALTTLYRILKPGGVLLATFPGITRIGHGEWGSTWYWSFTTRSAQRLFEEVFTVSQVAVETYGNVLAAVAFLHGLAVKELRQEELDYDDPDYQVIIAVRAIKPEVMQ